MTTTSLPPPTAAQQAAIEHVRATADRQRPDARRRIVEVLGGAAITTDVDGLVAAVARRGTVGLNFQPDRIAADGRMVVEAMHADGVYRSQFETRISNGGLTAFPGGDRDRWEEHLFGGAYQRPGVTAQERPRYGGLDLMDHPDGPCPRFGSCHLRLRPELRERTTFCFGDSHRGPRDVGTIDRFEPVVAALLEAAAAHGAVLGRPDTDVATLVDLLQRPPGGRAIPERPGRALDDYVEAQVHTPVRLADDADALVADPSFRGTRVGDLLAAVADRYDLALSWHAGFVLDVAAVRDDFRGPLMPALARRVADTYGDGTTMLHARLVGCAARSVVTDPDRWQDWAPPTDALQHLKQLWHVLVRYGDPADGRTASR